MILRIKIRYILIFNRTVYLVSVPEDIAPKAQVPPEFVETFTERIVNPGESISLECVAKGHPEPELEWFLYGKKIESSRNDTSAIRIGTYRSINGDVTSYLNITNAKTRVSKYILILK